MLCLNRRVLQLPRTATRCAGVLIRASSTSTAEATPPPNISDDASKPESTTRNDDGDYESPKRFKPRKPLYDREGNLVPEGWTIDTRTKKVRRIIKKAKRDKPKDYVAPPLVKDRDTSEWRPRRTWTGEISSRVNFDIHSPEFAEAEREARAREQKKQEEETARLQETLTSNLVRDPATGKWQPQGVHAKLVVRDRLTGEWRLRKSNKGTITKAMEDTPPEVLDFLEELNAENRVKVVIPAKQKAQQEEDEAARRRQRRAAKQAAKEAAREEKELQRQAKQARLQKEAEERQQRAAEKLARAQARRDAKEAKELAAAQEREARREREAQRIKDLAARPEEIKAEKAEKARIRNREHQRMKRAAAVAARESESAVAKLARISRETSEAGFGDLGGAQNKLATTRREITKRTKKSKRRLAAGPIFNSENFGVIGDRTKSMSERLEAVAPWKADRARLRLRPPKGLKDYNRVNIISEDLCDDILDHMGDDLDRHVGCDLLDLNPGVGVWSKKLHERLQPRKHLLLEADADVYQPFMGDFLQKPNVHLINTPPYLWTNLEQVMAEHLTEQTVQPSGAPKERNDTLLVTANIGWWPSQMLYRNSMGLMIAYQFIQAIHSSTLFQKYGNIRMLLWIDDHTKSRLIPRQMYHRRRFAFVAELATEYIHEIAGGEVDHKEADRRMARDMWLDWESNSMTFLRMKAAQHQIPEHRQPWYYKELLKSPELVGERLAGVRPPMFRRAWYNDLAKLNEVSDEALAEDGQTKLKKYYLTKRSSLVDKENQGHLEAIQMYDQAIAKYGTPEAQTHINDLLNTTKTWAQGQGGNFETIIDNYRLYRNPAGPQLRWDQRQFDPLRSSPEEYFPNVPISLVDIQPKTMAPILQQYGRLTTRSGDMSDLLLRPWFSTMKEHPINAMSSVWHGFGEKEIFDQCPSFTDPKAGGVPLEFGDAVGHRVRTTTEEQWLEVLKAWMEWPFRPTYVEMVGQSVEETASTDIGDDD